METLFSIYFFLIFLLLIIKLNNYYLKEENDTYKYAKKLEKLKKTDIAKFEKIMKKLSDL